MTFRRKVAAGEAPARPSALMTNELETATRFARDKWNENQGSQASQTMYRARAFGANMRNQTGVALSTQHIMGVDAPILTGETAYWEFVRNFTLNGVMPDEDKHQTNFCIANRPIGVANIGPCSLFGLLAVRVDVTHPGHQFATVITGDTTRLRSNETVGVPIVSKPLGTGDLMCVVALGGGGGGGGASNIVEFTVDSAFERSDPSVSATVTSVWQGEVTDTSIEVFNTCQIFSDPTGDACGVAISNADENGRYQIIQLECEEPAEMEASFVAALGDSITYAGTPTPVPFGRFTGATRGDLLTLEADGSYTFNRPPRSGVLEISVSSVIQDIQGIGSDGDKSIFQMQYDDLGGGGYAPLETAIAIGHPYFRVPPNNYGMGGTTFGQWTFSTSADVGHKLRLVVNTANGNTVSAEFLQSLFRVKES